MSYRLNGEDVEKSAATVAEMVEAYLVDGRSRGVAVAVNDEVVPRGEWSSTALADGDVIEIVKAVQGG